MTRVRKATAVAVLTPMAAAGIAMGVSAPASAADTCWLFAHASITGPSGPVTAGSKVHVSAKVSGMLMKAHLQISGPGLDSQVGKSATSGTIEGDVAVQRAGYFTLAVVGDGTGCTYDTTGFSAKERPGTPKPTPNGSPSKIQTPAGSGLGSLPTGVGSGTGGPGTGINLKPLNSGSPFSLPSVAPDGEAGVQFPTPDPQVAAPRTKPQAHSVVATPPVKWGQSVAAALVLLLLSAHLGMWSRRQRLAAAGVGRGGGARRTEAGTRPKTDVMDAVTTETADSSRAPVRESLPREAGTLTRETFGPDTQPQTMIDHARMPGATNDARMPGAWDAAGNPGGRRSSHRAYRGRRRR